MDNVLEKLAGDGKIVRVTKWLSLVQLVLTWVWCCPGGGGGAGLLSRVKESAESVQNLIQNKVDQSGFRPTTLSSAKGEC